jgi:hypothetical protein
VKARNNVRNYRGFRGTYAKGDQMAEQTGRRSCQQPGCTDEATRHATFNEQPLGIVETNEPGIFPGLRVGHADLCDPHLSELQKRFSDVTVKAGWQCTPECPTKG